MTMRAIGAFNGLLPEPTGMVIGYIRDPKSFPYLQYAQLVPAPDVQFSYYTLHPDDPTSLPRLNDFDWAYDDYRPTGKAFKLRGEWSESRTNRYDFPYTIGEETIRVWQKAGFNVRQLYDATRASHAALHRATRVCQGLLDASWASYNTAEPYSLLGLASAVYFDDSSGEELLVTGNANPNFQLIRRTFNRIKRRIHLSTNGVVRGDELIAVLPPAVAEKIAESGEMVNFLKQSPYAKDLTDPNIVDWNLPPRYAGFKLVVEDTVKCFINQKADGTVADVTVAAQKDYLFDEDSILFVSRPAGLDGGYGYQSFSTCQVYHKGGEARVEAFSDAKHEMVEGHIVMEDKVVTPSLVSGFKLTNVLR